MGSLLHVCYKNKTKQITAHKTKSKTKNTSFRANRPQTKTKIQVLVFLETKKTKKKSFRANQPGTQNQKPKVRLWFLVFRKNKNQKNKNMTPNFRFFGFWFFEKSKPKVEFWLLVRGSRPVGPKNFVFLFLFFRKNKNQNPSFDFG